MPYISRQYNQSLIFVIANRHTGELLLNISGKKFYLLRRCSACNYFVSNERLLVLLLRQGDIYGGLRTHNLISKKGVIVICCDLRSDSCFST